MKGMTFKSFPQLGTWLFGAAFLLATFWHSIFRDGWGFLISVILFFSLILYAFVSLLVALFVWSKAAWRRFLINAIALGLFIPTLAAGGFVRDEIFLVGLPRYQSMTDLMITQQKNKPAITSVHFPPGYSSMLLDERALIERGDDNSITVLYFTRDSSALGHDGYLYRSDDDPASLKKEHTGMGLKRLAPNWYAWGG